MARLPTKSDLSGPVSLRSGRAIASVDTSGIGRGIASAGQDIAALGAEIEQSQNAVDIARAEAYKTEQLLATQNAFEDDPDYATFDKRAPERTGEVVKNGAHLIRDRNMRARWEASAQADAARTNDTIFDRGRAIKRQAETVAFDEALEANRRLYVDPDTSDDVKAKARGDIEGAIAAGLSSGLLTPEQADQRRQQYIEDADFSRGQLAIERDPSVVAKPLPAEVSDRAAAAMAFYESRGYSKVQAAGIVGNLIAESNLRPSGAVGDGGTAFGIAQWRGERLNRLKRYAASNNLDWQDFETQLAFVDVELQSQETAAFRALKDAKTVDEATAAFIGYERPAGWTSKNPRGGHNYSGRLNFAARAAGQEVNPDWYQRLSPEHQAKLQREADAARTRKNVELQGFIEVAANNAPAAIQNTGRYDGSLPSIEQFVDAYGPQDGPQKYNAFQTSIETSEQAFEMRTMSPAQIQEMVAAATPVSSGDNAALEQKRFEVLSGAASATLKARNADPAAYTRQTFPEVERAWSGDMSAPGSYQNALAETAAAQRQLGIERPRLLPANLADAAIGKFEDEELPEDQRIAAVTQTILGTSDPMQRRALFDQLVEAGLPDITEGAIEAAARGDEGAARRLFRAAMIDPAKLPGQSPEKPAAIDETIQSELMDVGQIGDVYYGLSDGSTENFVRAQRDQKLINNAVQVRIRKGESLSSAVAAVAKDLYGDVNVFTGNSAVNAQILVPAGDDGQAIINGLEGLLPDVRGALATALTVPSDAPTADSTRAVLDAATQNYIDNVMAEGYFRNSGDGFAFIDPFTGLAVSDQNGEPIIFTTQEAIDATPVRELLNEEERERQFLEERSRSFGTMGGAQ
ncbi:phage tail tip lysozyme [Chelativorans xinjiangense]|uniref:phage tail tip lysozyme n=1 Tax=Chelativorans xinjiangense TaxID=2681485 RepID=UPI00135AA9C3|nr:phage tail tip lysozyme [Chelativorans xinjiangense]